MKPQTLNGQLAGFTGTAKYYKHTLGFRGTRFLFTEGVQHMAEIAQAYWLLDVVFSHAFIIYNSRPIPDDQKRLLVCKLTLRDDGGADFVIEDGNYNQLASQRIEFTDFPAREQVIWVQNGVAMLPGEY